MMQELRQATPTQRITPIPILQIEQLSLWISGSDVSEKWLGISDENGGLLVIRENG